MIELKNAALDKLRAGELSIGVGLRQARTVDVAKIMYTAGFDWLFIDMEHNSMDMDMAVQISVAAHETGITPIVRVPGYEHYHATRALDGGAQGIVFRTLTMRKPLPRLSRTAVIRRSGIAPLPGHCRSSTSKATP